MFTIIDFIVIGIVLLIPFIIAYLFTIIKRPRYEELVNGGGKLKVIPISISLVIGLLTINYETLLDKTADHGPDQLRLVTRGFAVIAAIPLALCVFLPVFYNLHLKSIFEYLELRFESVVIRWLASSLFIIVTIGFTIFSIRIPSIILEDAFDFPFWITGLLIGICGISYAALGGLVAVIYCQIFQLIIVISGVIVVILKGIEVSGGLQGVVNSTFTKDSLKFDFSLNLLSNANDLNIILGIGFLSFCLTGIHQSHFQRYSSVSSHLKSYLTLGLSIPLICSILALIIFMIATVFTAYCFKDSNDHNVTNNPMLITVSVLRFVAELLKSHYGINGLIFSSVLSWLLSFFSSMLHSLAVITIEDFLVKIPKFRVNSNSACSAVFCSLVVVYGVIITSIALIPEELLDSIIPFIIQLYFAIIGIISIAFIAGMFLPFVNKHGIGFAMIVSLGFMLSYELQKQWNIIDLHEMVYLNSTIQQEQEKCSSNIGFNDYYSSVWKLLVASKNWDAIILGIPPNLHSCLSAIVTLTISILVSILTGGCCKCKTVKPEYLHPILHYCFPKRNSSVDYPEHPLLRNHSLSDSHRRVDRLSGTYNGFSLGKVNSTHSLFYQRYETIPIDEIPPYNSIDSRS